MKKIKRILSVLLVCCLFSALLPSAALAADIIDSGTWEDNITWELDSEGTLTISGNGAMPDAPNPIGVPWCSNKDSIVNVIIKDGVTCIGSYAFYYCSKLTSILISDDVSNIGTYAFSGCSELTEIVIPKHVVSIGAWAFYRCTNLKSISIPEGVSTIEMFAFSECSNLTDVYVPQNVTSIEDRAFLACVSLVNITIPNGVTLIGPDAFSGCNSLSKVVIPNSVINIGARAFAGCNLNEINIPASVLSIGESPFSWCINLANIIVDADNPNYKNDDFGVLFSKDGSTLIQVPCKLAGKYEIPDSVATIGASAFAGCGHLINISIPDNVVNIGGEAFSGCTSLVDISIPTHITKINSYTFFCCESLTSVTIPVSINYIGANAFDGCFQLTDVYYAGNPTEWATINWGTANGTTGNDALLNATIHYNSTGPEGEEKPEPDDDPEPDAPEDSNSDNDITSHTLAFHSSLANTDAFIHTEWGWDLFLDSEIYPSTRYESRLAVAGLALSAASEYSQNRVETMLAELGFESDLILSQNYHADWHDLSSPGVTFAHKSVKHNGEDMHVIVAVLRGTTTISDMVTDFASLVDGFSVSEYGVYQMLEQYIDACSRNRGEVTLDNVKFFVTGHSLGGAVANLLAGRLTKLYGESNVFAYTYAAPKTVVSADIQAHNVFNLVNQEDSVPRLSTRLSWYGNACRFHRMDYSPKIYEQFTKLTGGLDLKSTMSSLWLPDSLPFIGIMSQYAHATETYMAYLLSRGDAEYIEVEPAPCVRIHCPVDVEVYTNQGVLVGRVTSNEVDTTIPAGVYIEVDDDEKNIYLLYDGEYVFQLTGTDAGTMTYSTELVDLDTGETIKGYGTVFENVALTNGKQMISTVTIGSDDGDDSSVNLSNVELFVLDDEGELESQVQPDGTEVPISSDDVPEEPGDPDGPDTSTPPSQSSGGSRSPRYAITTPAADHGTISISPSRASYGDTVAITADPDEGYKLETITVTAANGDEIAVRNQGNNRYTFTMPRSKVSIEVSFGEINAPLIFVDVPVDAYYYNAVYWAMKNGVTNGSNPEGTLFSPDSTVSRAQMVTFLWRAYGSPKSTGSNPFTDVRESDYCYDAVLWAVANGVTNGTSATTFSPNTAVTRAQAVTFQWRAAGSPAISGSSFDDVAAGAYYAGAVTWAVANGITNGTGSNNFSPDVTVSRAQAVTFLHRELAE